MRLRIFGRCWSATARACTLVLILAIGGGVGCKKASDVLVRELEKDYPCREIVLGDTSKRGILIIGDSISIGYTPFVRAALPDFDVLHNPCNALNSAVTLDLLDRWLAIRDRWFAIVFNVGLWDIMKSTSVYPNEYKRNLEEIALKLKKASPNVLFALTTAVPAHAPGRSNSEAVFYNSIARKVMARQHIAIIDLYSLSVRLADHHIHPESQTDVHFDKTGYEELAQPVAAALKHLSPILPAASGF